MNIEIRIYKWPDKLLVCETANAFSPHLFSKAAIPDLVMIKYIFQNSAFMLTEFLLF